MKRKYNAEQAMRAITLLRESIPNVQFTTDVIVGFPLETEEEFAETVDFIRKAGFLTVHIFPYSKRAGTPAATMSGQISKEIKHQRLLTLTEAVEQTRRPMLEALVAKQPTVEVLFETFENGILFGHTASFLEVAVPHPLPRHGEIGNVRLTHTDGTVCFGEWISLVEGGKTS